MDGGFAIEVISQKRPDVASNGVRVSDFRPVPGARFEACHIAAKPGPDDHAWMARCDGLQLMGIDQCRSEQLPRVFDSCANVDASTEGQSLSQQDELQVGADLQEMQRPLGWKV